MENNGRNKTLEECSDRIGPYSRKQTIDVVNEYEQLES